MKIWHNVLPAMPFLNVETVFPIAKIKQQNEHFNTRRPKPIHIHSKKFDMVDVGKHWSAQPSDHCKPNLVGIRNGSAILKYSWTRYKIRFCVIPAIYIMFHFNNIASSSWLIRGQLFWFRLFVVILRCGWESRGISTRSRSFWRR